MQLSVFKFQSEEEQQFNEIMTVDIDGKIWFVASDVCNTLGLTNPTEALKSLDDDEKLTSELLRAGQMRKVNLINESGLYTLIFKSRKPSALQFRKWVTKEVIPSIRQKGFYGKIDRTQLPNFYLRYKENVHRIDRNFFSVISELFVTLNAELDKVGYEIPDKGIKGQGMYPDISVGKIFSNYLKKTNSPFEGSHKYYNHSFPDDRADVEARMYPIEVLPTFRKFIFEKWIPENAHNYFKERDPLALDYLPKLLGK
ncbi:Bro-N domain-containing protein [Flavobacterium sp. CSZ]|uniref:BRO-N domain-containing protein n=1 Tax=Flavobacterium sp. CSZ TaxID=2783791 RepID=UPI00188D1FF0|nr:Bro-N domain-containing protein [Flavobacterium sp. CSZ]MBF4487724.1 Bro-N domain-containing protein [Flavobacterium sp. CSZ]